MLLLCIFVILPLLYLIFRRYQFVRRVNKLPCPFPAVSLGVTGHTSYFSYAGGEDDRTVVTMRIIDTVRTIINHPSGVACIWVGPLPFVIIFSPEAAEVRVFFRSKTVFRA